MISRSRSVKSRCVLSMMKFLVKRLDDAMPASNSSTTPNAPNYSSQISRLRRARGGPKSDSFTAANSPVSSWWRQSG